MAAGRHRPVRADPAAAPRLVGDARPRAAPVSISSDDYVARSRRMAAAALGNLAERRCRRCRHRIYNRHPFKRCCARAAFVPHHAASGRNSARHHRTHRRCLHRISGSITSYLNKHQGSWRICLRIKATSPRCSSRRHRRSWPSLHPAERLGGEIPPSTSRHAETRKKPSPTNSRIIS